MLLDQISQSSTVAGADADLQALVLGAMKAESPWFNYARFYPITGNADTFVKPSTQTGGTTRTVNNDYSGANTSVTEGTVTLRILGDALRTDISIERRGFTPQSERARQLESFARGLARYIVDQSINGTGTSPAMHGITALIDSGQVLSMGTDGAPVPLGNESDIKSAQQFFLEKIDEMIETVAGGAQVLVMNGRTIARLKAIAREYISITNVVDAFGTQQTLTSYNGIPIINSGYGKDGTTLVIPNTETVGVSDDCTSIYAIRFGEKDAVTYATSKGLQVYDRGMTTVHYNTLVEMDVNMAIVNPKSVAKLTGIRLDGTIA